MCDDVGEEESKQQGLSLLRSRDLVLSVDKAEDHED